MATDPVEVCPKVLTTTSRLTTYPPTLFERYRSMNMLVLCIGLAKCMHTLLPVKLQDAALRTLAFKYLVIPLVSLGQVWFAINMSCPLGAFLRTVDTSLYFPAP